MQIPVRACNLLNFAKSVNTPVITLFCAKQGIGAPPFLVMLRRLLIHHLVADKALPTVRNKAEFHARETDGGVLTLGPVD